MPIFLLALFSFLFFPPLLFNPSPHRLSFCPFHFRPPFPPPRSSSQSIHTFLFRCLIFSGINHLSQPCIYERKSRFMKWLSKLSSSSREGATTGEHQPQFLGDENTVFRAPSRALYDRSSAEREKEELDRAIAFSLSEDLKNPHGYRWHTDNNEDYSRPFHDRLNPPSYPPIVPREYYPTGYR